MVIEHARRHGFPVPRVVEIQENALVLERIEGRRMSTEIFRHAWRARRYVDVFAALHRRLHRIPAPAELASAGRGETLIHLDFHPENILMSPHGPIVIDWTNARRGDPALDVAMTWVILATSAGLPGRLVVPRYLAHFDADETFGALSAAAARRLDDPNVTDRERRVVGRLVERKALQFAQTK
jgi:aminoglycoside phosphotransferase (APT) family kinase protein